MTTTDARAPVAHLIIASIAGRVGLERLARFAQPGEWCIVIGNERDVSVLRDNGCAARVQPVASGFFRYYQRWVVCRQLRGMRVFAWDAAARALVPGAHAITATEVLERAPIERAEWTLSERDAKRRQLGVREGELLIGLLCNAPRMVDVFSAASMTSFLRTDGLPVRLLVHPTMLRLAQSALQFARMGAGPMLLVNEVIERPWEFAPLLDAAILDADGALIAPSALPAIWALAHDTPTLVHRSIALPPEWDHKAIRFGDDQMCAIRALRIAVEKRESGVAIERAK